MGFANWFSESAENIAYHIREGNVNWPNVAKALGVHVMALYGLTVMHQCKMETLVMTLIIYVFTTLGVTAGAHRLWSHRAYKARLPYRIFMMVMFTMANQSSIVEWAENHRAHHRYSDQDGDPYDASRGFFFCHIGWLLIHKSKKTMEAKKAQDMSDLWADPVVAFQERFPAWFKSFVCFIVPGLMTKYICGDSFWLGVLIPGAVRYLVSLHVSFCVNSFAHFFGDQPYDAKLWPRENVAVSLASLGEGWHNWHHKYPFDYAASEHGILQQFNVAKAFIDFAALIGQVDDRKRATGAWAIAKRNRARAAAAPNEPAATPKSDPLHSLQEENVQVPPAQ